MIICLMHIFAGLRIHTIWSSIEGSLEGLRLWIDSYTMAFTILIRLFPHFLIKYAARMKKCLRTSGSLPFRH